MNPETGELFELTEKEIELMKNAEEKGGQYVHPAHGNLISVPTKDLSTVQRMILTDRINYAKKIKKARAKNKAAKKARKKNR